LEQQSPPALHSPLQHTPPLHGVMFAPAMNSHEQLSQLSFVHEFESSQWLSCVHSNPSSILPSQLSSSPLQISVGEVGTQFDSQEPSPSVSIHPSSQTVEHLPALHTGRACRSGGQTMPQSPQLSMSVFTSTQAPAQGNLPGGHSIAQVPALQTSAGRHSLKHSPQWLWSELTSTHSPPHFTSPGRQPDSAEVSAVSAVSSEY